MVNKIWNWIKQAITPHRQKDEHLEFYEDRTRVRCCHVCRRNCKTKKDTFKT